MELYFRFSSVIILVRNNQIPSSLNALLLLVALLGPEVEQYGTDYSYHLSVQRYCANIYNDNETMDHTLVV